MGEYGFIQLNALRCEKRDLQIASKRKPQEKKIERSWQ